MAKQSLSDVSYSTFARRVSGVSQEMRQSLLPLLKNIDLRCAKLEIQLGIDVRAPRQ